MSIGVGDDCVIDLGDIVIVARDPEERYDRRPERGGETFGLPRGGECLVDRIQGAGEEPRLLAGDDDERSRFESVDRLRRLVRGAPRCVLPAEDGREFRARIRARGDRIRDAADRLRIEPVRPPERPGKIRIGEVPARESPRRQRIDRSRRMHPAHQRTRPARMRRDDRIP